MGGFGGRDGPVGVAGGIKDGGVNNGTVVCGAFEGNGAGGGHEEGGGPFEAGAVVGEEIDEGELDARALSGEG